jgi:cell division septation protein DedD
MITAEAEPYKRVPDERGGIEIDDLDRRLYDAMDGSTRPPAAQPAAANLQTGLLAGPPRDLRPSASGGSNRVATGDVEAEDLPPIDATPRDEVETSTRPSETDLSVQPEPQEPKPSLSGQPDTGLSFTPGGQFLVQISAVRSEAAANDAWTRLTGQHPEIFGGASKLIERADLGAKGVFFRLRAGRFGTREGAAEFCTAYKQAGGDCIVVREST